MRSKTVSHYSQLLNNDKTVPPTVKTIKKEGEIQNVFTGPKTFSLPQTQRRFEKTLGGGKSTIRPQGAAYKLNVPFVMPGSQEEFYQEEKSRLESWLYSYGPIHWKKEKGTGKIVADHDRLVCPLNNPLWRKLHLQRRFNSVKKRIDNSSIKNKGNRNFYHHPDRPKFWKYYLTHMSKCRKEIESFKLQYQWYSERPPRVEDLLLHMVKKGVSPNVFQAKPLKEKHVLPKKEDKKYTPRPVLKTLAKMEPANQELELYATPCTLGDGFIMIGRPYTTYEHNEVSARTELINIRMERENTPSLKTEPVLLLGHGLTQTEEHVKYMRGLSVFGNKMYVEGTFTTSGRILQFDTHRKETFPEPSHPGLKKIKPLWWSNYWSEGSLDLWHLEKSMEQQKNSRGKEELRPTTERINVRELLKRIFPLMPKNPPLGFWFRDRPEWVTQLHDQKRLSKWFEERENGTNVIPPDMWLGEYSEATRLSKWFLNKEEEELSKLEWLRYQKWLLDRSVHNERGTAWPWKLTKGHYYKVVDGIGPGVITIKVSKTSPLVFRWHVKPNSFVNRALHFVGRRKSQCIPEFQQRLELQKSEQSSQPETTPESVMAFAYLKGYKARKAKAIEVINKRRETEEKLSEDENS